MYELWQHYFIFINRYLNIFLTFYWWVFYVPFLEIGIGVFICGPNSFLMSDREKETEVCVKEKSVLLQIVSMIHIILTFTTGLVIIFFFRNHKFNEENRLKRRFKPLNNTVQLVSRSALMVCYYVGSEDILVYKHLICYVLTVFCIADVFLNFPFTVITVLK